MRYDQAIEKLRSAIAHLLETLSKREWRTSEEISAIRGLEQVLEDTATVEVDDSQIRLQDIREILHPKDDPDRSWSPSTLDEIDRIANQEGVSMMTKEEMNTVLDQSSTSWMPRGEEIAEGQEDLIDKAHITGEENGE